MLKWEENGHKLELRMLLNEGVWEGKDGREVFARDVIAALEANPAMKAEVMAALAVPPERPWVEFSGLYRGQPVKCALRQDCDNPVRLSGTLNLTDDVSARVLHWPAHELPLWRVAVDAPDDARLEGEAYELQGALKALEEKVLRSHAWFRGLTEPQRARACRELPMKG